jgi:membrane associated rhomboid family serine protease
LRRPPPLKNFMKYPIVSAAIALAVGITLASWSGKVDISPLCETIDIRRGQLWRILTSALPHANILHLGFNLYWTWALGTLVEERFGHWKTLAIFVLLAIVANGAEYAILVGAIGLSGVVYGLFGLLWVLSRFSPNLAGVIDRKTIGLFVLWFFFCIFLTVAGTPIANIAHGVGVLAGATMGWAISAPSRREVGFGALSALVVAVLAGSTLARPWINLSTYRGYDEANLGYDDLVAGRNAEALHWLRDAVIMQPRISGFWFNLGIAYDRLNQHSDAVAAYRKARDLEPNNAQYQAAASED